MLIMNTLRNNDISGAQLQEVFRTNIETASYHFLTTVIVFS